MPRPDFIFYLSTVIFLISNFSFNFNPPPPSHGELKGETIHPLPPAGYSPCLRGRVSYNRKYRASQLSL